ncbi:3-oxoadipate enol-lactonase 2 [Burkholderia oklahomensis]|uniref:alpha/beta fold hydrolase n=1 Tax=Burkholderia oklahomensis TaxID=342113 RepID=UPI00016A9814|nr:alpha/beta hydrolase [Burkholderia oklahomensis]AJX31030.1 alpha/beta hydrolase family protein [Burkholderia oklahomensis C6786]AOI45657.1 alpha/beta hydrolase [Burkholderia oklahomensis C6786]KUY64837.1 alpha/beta hydrolase [Burkholderia oklahomensis C6786]MBI0358237.1 alpha/beta hydrolase [Burkholderia oklahomensis]SUW56169.1 3-oxoadipate enol-lactonase 2 [Burkholderia oklahomensis]
MHESNAAVPDDSTIDLRVLRTIGAFRHLAASLPGPVRLCLFDDACELRSASDAIDAQRLVAVAFARIGVTDARFAPDGAAQLSSFELLMSRRISAAFDYRYDRFRTPDDADRARREAERFDFHALPAGVERVPLPREAGVSLSAYASGRRDRPAVALALPCGMPLDLCLRWLDALAERHFVLTWETRAMFGACDAFDRVSSDVDAQVDDLFAVMDRFGVERAHVMGICGGAVVALRAAVARRERTTSLSLWYGDYNLSDDALRTKHQQNYAWLMEAAAQGRDAARDLQRMFADRSTLVTVPAEIAHAALYPYANAELMYRYAKLSDALNKADVLSSLSRVSVPTLVVAGDDDDVTHCGGSVFVAGRVPGARLEVEAGGSHARLFRAPAASTSLALRFFSSLR